ncbi:monooxygenase [Prauserella marina]|uniref:FMN-dependent oxidoreductase, nitrilotriacetate monooxygenase family n=1 Tax=Prauserella marina TaxID=530584 RepID=A0A222VR37_9PSEU|nr:LLM class flavin-dependent oxidoreductase [Prauserella marina]ASR36378.1 monooxygenase [Prauserella marina]PWV77178.1 FMN-dependent oxidoreductase (nitrilotriacetate monooxygenase family) [Prauserella marina]SDD06210.1 FMN-dependent oxidoreductase, nitrilotriacetate monooxygenase family [Prauserella marina]
MSRTLHLNVFIHGRGHHEAAWRHPRAGSAPLTDIGFYEQIAAIAERGRFDSVFFADHLAIGSEVRHAARGALEPLTLLAALARATEHIGLIATASSTYTEPYNLARQFASIDHISGGRAGWNIVTSWLKATSANFGDSAQLGHDERYDRAFEYLDVVTKLWDSWADDAHVDDRHSGTYVDADRVRAIRHSGRYYQVAGALNVPRSPQGRPLLVQAGSSDKGRQFAATYAEAVFTAHLEKATAVEFSTDLKARAAALGRDPGHVLVLPGLSPAIGSTEAEAAALWDELNALTVPEVGLGHLSARFGGADLSHLSLDERLSPGDLPDPANVEGAQSRAELIHRLVASERPTLRALLHKLAGGRGHYITAGTPEQIADVIEDWFRSGAADGFNVMPPILPAVLTDFVEQVVPILQRRGLFRREYTESTLRGHYGLSRPENRFFPAGR